MVLGAYGACAASRKAVMMYSEQSAVSYERQATLIVSLETTDLLHVTWEM